MGTGTADFLIFSCFGSSPVERVRVEAGGNVKVNAGNLVIGTSGKGIDFTALMMRQCIALTIQEVIQRLGIWWFALANLIQQV